MNCKYHGGYVLWEVMASIAIVAVLTTVLLPMVQTLTHAVDSKRRTFDDIALDRGMRDQLSAHWNRLGQFGCTDSDRIIEIGDSVSQPQRISKANLDNESDWLRGSDTGQCAGYGRTQERMLTVTLPCAGVDAGDGLQVDSCYAAEQASVISSEKGVVTAQLMNQQLFDRTVLVGTQRTFYWYVGKGKSGANALWRKPFETGNALELFPSLFRMRLYPILDRDMNGVAEEIAIHYGQFSVHQLKALLVEYEYEIAECVLSSPLAKTYYTLRGDTWRYDPACHSIGKAIIALGEQNEIAM